MTEKKNDANDISTVNDLLSAISETEYPQYILDALERIQEWMKASMTPLSPQDNAPFNSFFDTDRDDEGDIDNLHSQLASLENYVDLLPNTNPPEGHSDVIVASLTPPDYYDVGLRTAIDYATLFNRNCKRVWIVSDKFIFDEIVRYTAHVDALARQGVSLRFILVTPWGWVEIPLSGARASSQQFLWKMPSGSRKKGRKNNG